MAENYHYHRIQNPWAQHMDNREFFPQGLLPPPSAQQLLYHNIQLQGLQQTLGQTFGGYMKCHSHAAKMTRSFTNSATSSPLSTLSCEESLDVTSSTTSIHDAVELRTVSPATLQTDLHSQKFSPSPTQAIDAPMDLSKPKPGSNVNKSGSTPHSRLARLLSRKRSSVSEHDGNSLCHEQSRPLNLSKKFCMPPKSQSSPENCNIIDMNDAVDNPVQLVKLSNQSQVAEQVTKFLNQMVGRIFSLEQFHSIQAADQIGLVMGCWHRLILWIYAENQFTFQVTSLTADSQKLEHTSSSQQIQPPRLNQPTMAFVRSIATFIKKYQTLEVDCEELRLLFAITLFHSTGEETYEESEKIVNCRKAFMRQLHAYVTANKKCSTKRYSDLLLYLPMLYGVNGKMIEELFYQHLSAYADIKTILRETIRGFPSRPCP